MTSNKDDSWLSAAVSRWRNTYISGMEDHSNFSKLLVNKDLAMYQAIGCITDNDLARQMVSDYSVQQAEQTIGHLFELVLEEVGLEKVEDKKSEGRFGLDFIQRIDGQRRLVELSAKPNSKSGSQRKGRVSNMLANEAFWIKQKNDNPLSPTLETVKVWASARGPSRCRPNRDGILEVVGDAMWSYFGLGESFTRRLSQELGKQQISMEELDSLKRSMEQRIADYLRENNYSDHATGNIDYASLITDHP